jgi:hypothetical protein
MASRETIIKDPEGLRTYFRIFSPEERMILLDRFDPNHSKTRFSITEFSKTTKIEISKIKGLFKKLEEHKALYYNKNHKYEKMNKFDNWLLNYIDNDCVGDPVVKIKNIIPSTLDSEKIKKCFSVLNNPELVMDYLLSVQRVSISDILGIIYQPREVAKVFISNLIKLGVVQKYYTSWVINPEFRRWLKEQIENEPE